MRGVAPAAQGPVAAGPASSDPVVQPGAVFPENDRSLCRPARPRRAQRCCPPGALSGQHGVVGTHPERAARRRQPARARAGRARPHHRRRLQLVDPGQHRHRLAPAPVLRPGAPALVRRAPERWPYRGEPEPLPDRRGHGDAGRPRPGQGPGPVPRAPAGRRLPGPDRLARAGAAPARRASLRSDRHLAPVFRDGPGQHQGRAGALDAGARACRCVW